MHLVKGTQLVREWRNGEFEPLEFNDYVNTVIAIVKKSPDEIIFHRLTGTASNDILVAPAWCNKKWQVLNAITQGIITYDMKNRNSL